MGAKTCQETNPGLYYPTKYYIYFQLYLSVFAMLIIGAHRLMILASTLLRKEEGCAEAVRNLPKVQAGDDQFLDPDTNGVLGCPVCMNHLQTELCVQHATTSSMKHAWRNGAQTIQIAHCVAN